MDGKGPNPELVAFSESEAQRLIQFYDQVEKELLDAINRAILKGNQISYLQQMKTNVDAILGQLRKGSLQWCEEAIPTVYMKSVQQVDAQLKGAGAGFKKPTKRQIPSNNEFLSTALYMVASGGTADAFKKKEITRLVNEGDYQAAYDLVKKWARYQENGFGSEMYQKLRDFMQTQQVDSGGGYNLNQDMTIAGGFGGIHQHAAQVLAENTFNRLDSVATVIGRRVDDIYRQVGLNSVRGAVVGHDTWKQAAKKVKTQLTDQGMTGFTDKSGRQWNMKTYAQMVARTTTMEAHLEGTANGIVEYGRDLVQVSYHNNPCPLCAPWEGRVLSLTGKTEGYPTLDDAKGDGLFHPNCRHAYGLYVPELA